MLGSLHRGTSHCVFQKLKGTALRCDSSPLALPVQAKAGGRRRGAEQALGRGPGWQPREASRWSGRRRGRLAGLGGRWRRRRWLLASGTQARGPSVQGDVVEKEEGGLTAPGVPAPPRHGRRVPGGRRGPGGAGGQTRGSSHRGRGHARVPHICN